MSHFKFKVMFSQYQSSRSLIFFSYSTRPSLTFWLASLLLSSCAFTFCMVERTICWINYSLSLLQSRGWRPGCPPHLAKLPLGCKRPPPPRKVAIPRAIRGAPPFSRARPSTVSPPTYESDCPLPTSRSAAPSSPAPTRTCCPAPGCAPPAASSGPLYSTSALQYPGSTPVAAWGRTSQAPPSAPARHALASR